MHFDQAGYDRRCEWGLEGLMALQPDCDAVVIVDVLSFSTAVDIALSKGAEVLPYRWKDASAKRFAAAKNAVLAGRRDARTPYSLSPASLRSIAPGTRLVLPSPNGSTLALSAKRVPLFTACLRNAPAVARHAATLGSRIAVIPAGERWNESSLRACLEDWIGAGAVLSELPGTASPEAEMAVAAFSHFRRNPGPALFGCGSGKELVDKGFGEDVELALEYAVSPVVPVLAGDRFIDGRFR